MNRYIFISKLLKNILDYFSLKLIIVIIYIEITKLLERFIII